jgi:hypothetical protein
MHFSKKWAIVSMAAISGLAGTYASAALTIDAGPGYTGTPEPSGYRSGTSSYAGNTVTVGSSSGSGLAVASSTYYNGSTGTSADATVSNGFVITPTGPIILNQPALMPDMVTPFSNTAYAYSALGINSGASLIVGASTNPNAAGGSSTVATVWTPNGTAYQLPLPATIGFNEKGQAVDDVGTVVGGGAAPTNPSFVYYNANAGLGGAPSYASGTPVQLGYGANTQSASVQALTDNGVAVGNSGVSSTGNVASLWAAGNTPTVGVTSIAPTQLNITLPSSGPYSSGWSFTKNTSTGASSIVATVSTQGVAGGTVSLFNSTNGSFVQPVRWTPSDSNGLTGSTVGTILSLPTTAAYTGGSVSATSNNGDAAGIATGPNQQPVLWKPGTITPTILSTVTSPVVNPGSYITPASSGYNVKGVNDAEYTVGYSTLTSTNTTPNDALVWDPNGNVTELNSLVSLVAGGGSTSGWVSLVAAYGITDNDWISGLGVYYDPTVDSYSGGNPAPASIYGAGTYYRTFEIQDTSAVPEPASIATLLLAGSLGMLRRRRSRGA